MPTSNQVKRISLLGISCRPAGTAMPPRLRRQGRLRAGRPGTGPRNGQSFAPELCSPSGPVGGADGCADGGLASLSADASAGWVTGCAAGGPDGPTTAFAGSSLGGGDDIAGAGRAGLSGGVTAGLCFFSNCKIDLQAATLTAPLVENTSG